MPDPHNATAPAARRGQRKNIKASLLLASLNTRGFRSSTDQSEDTKWQRLHQLIRNDGIGILALQETHLTSDRVETLHRLYGRRLRILTSVGPETSVS